jgi:hypothetical protein
MSVQKTFAGVSPRRSNAPPKCIERTTELKLLRRRLKSSELSLSRHEAGMRLMRLELDNTPLRAYALFADAVEIEISG